MRVQVAQTQQGLKKQHGSCPDGWAATKPGQYLLAQQGLHLEQQKCAREYRQRKGHKTPRIGRVSQDSRAHGWTGFGIRGELKNLESAAPYVLTSWDIRHIAIAFFDVNGSEIKQPFQQSFARRPRFYKHIFLIDRASWVERISEIGGHRENRFEFKNDLGI